MRRASFLFALIAAGTLMLAVPLQAQPIPSPAKPPAAVKPAPAPRPPAPPKLPLEKPYKPIPLTMAPAPDDPSFASFRQQLAETAKNRVFTALARLVVPQGFFWAGDVSREFNPKRSPAENFAAAIRLESGNGWSALAAFAAMPEAAPMASRPGVICAPARPEFDEVDFDRVNTATISPAGWIYPRTAGVAMRAAPRPAAALVETLGLHLVRLLAYEPSETDSDPVYSAWVRVAAPSGKTGFVPPGMLFPLRSDQLCYLKDVTGRWRIAGYVTTVD